MLWKGVLKLTKPCGSVRVFILCAVVAWWCPFGAVCELILISTLTVTNLNSTETSGMLKLCHFPGTNIQNNLSYKIVRPFVSYVLTECLLHWALSARSNCNSFGEWSRFLVVPRHGIALLVALRQYLQSWIWGWTFSSDFFAFLSCSFWDYFHVAIGIQTWMKCMWIKSMLPHMHSIWTSIWACVCWYVSLVIKQLKKKGSVHRQFWHCSPGKWQLAREYWGRAKTIWRIPNADVGYSSFFALVSLFTPWACSLPPLCQVDAGSQGTAGGRDRHPGCVCAGNQMPMKWKVQLPATEIWPRWA